MILYYILVDRQVRPCESYEAMVEWRKTVEPGSPAFSLQIAKTTVNNVYVSTIFLPIDHGWGVGPPVVFETMTFDHGGHPQWDEKQWRYTSQDAAEAGHAAVVSAIEADADPDGLDI